jgi:hypothetical protein
MQGKRNTSNTQALTRSRPASGKAQSRLMVACAAGWRQTVERLLAKGVDANHVNEDGETPLTYAAAWKRGSVVDCLLANGAVPDLPSQSGWTPLMYAALLGDETSVVALLDAGADGARQDSLGRSAAELAATAGHARCAWIIRSRAISWRASEGRVRPAPASRRHAHHALPRAYRRRVPGGIWD